MKTRAFLELLSASGIWGFGFIATIWALKSVDAVSMSLIRFGIAFLIGLVGFLAFEKFKPNWPRHRDLFRLSFAPGIFLGLTLGLQTWGLQYTKATNSGFITTLYVVIVPFFESFVLRKRLPRFHYFWVLLALVGTGLMIEIHLEPFNRGDFLTLLCSFFAAAQIAWIGQVQARISSPFLFNAYQSFWATLSTALIYPFYENLYFHAPDTKAWIGLVSLTLGSTLIAFALQVRAQKILPASIASVVFLLESPFAALFAMYFLGEFMNASQSLGCLMIFIAALGATFVERILTRKSKTPLPL